MLSYVAARSFVTVEYVLVRQEVSRVRLGTQKAGSSRLAVDTRTDSGRQLKR